MPKYGVHLRVILSCVCIVRRLGSSYSRKKNHILRSRPFVCLYITFLDLFIHVCILHFCILYYNIIIFVCTRVDGVYSPWLYIVVGFIFASFQQIKIEFSSIITAPFFFIFFIHFHSIFIILVYSILYHYIRGMAASLI